MASPSLEDSDEDIIPLTSDSPFVTCPSCGMAETVPLLSEQYRPSYSSSGFKPTLMLWNRSRGGGIPLMYSGDRLAGHLAVTLSSLGKFKAISMTVRGVAKSYFAKCDIVFLNSRHDLYSCVRNGSHLVDAPIGHILPFDFEWPSLTNSVQDQSHRLPPTIRLPYPPKVSVEYIIEVEVRRSRWQSNYRATFPITYLPRRRPRVPSILRSLAYAEGRPAPTWDDDPEGWSRHETSSCGSKHISNQALLFLPSPPCYARNLPIPIYVEIQGGNDLSTAHDLEVYLEQQLDLLVVLPHSSNTSYPRRSYTYRFHTAKLQSISKINNTGRLVYHFDLLIGNEPPSFAIKFLSCQDFVVSRLKPRRIEQFPTRLFRIPVKLVTDQARYHSEVERLLGSDLGHLPPMHESSDPPSYENRYACSHDWSSQIHDA